MNVRQGTPQPPLAPVTPVQNVGQEVECPLYHVQPDLEFAVWSLSRNVGLPSPQIHLTSEIQDILAPTLLQMVEHVSIPLTKPVMM